MQVMSQNRRAFLHMITRSEIPDHLYKLSDKGYAAIVGNNLFPRLPNGNFDYSKHPLESDNKLTASLRAKANS